MRFVELPSVNVNIKLLYLIVCENKNDYVIGQWLLARVKSDKEEIYRKHDFRIWRIKLELIKKNTFISILETKKMAGSESTDDMNFNFNLIIFVYEKPHQQNHKRWLKMVLMWTKCFTSWLSFHTAQKWLHVVICCFQQNMQRNCMFLITIKKVLLWF